MSRTPTQDIAYHRLDRATARYTAALKAYLALPSPHPPTPPSPPQQFLNL